MDPFVEACQQDYEEGSEDGCRPSRAQRHNIGNLSNLLVGFSLRWGLGTGSTYQGHKS